MTEKVDIRKNQSIINAFANAFNGCRFAFLTQRNFLIHAFLSAVVIILSFWLQISLEKFLFLFFAIIVGLGIEMANTAFEKTVDLVTEEYSPKAKIAKDVSAGMVLIVSVGLAVIGLLILLPPLLQKLSELL